MDAQGRVFYSDKPPPSDAREADRLRFNTRPGEEPLPYAVREAAKNFPVTLYSGDCGEPCNVARNLLDARGVPFVFKDGGETAVQEELKKLSGGTGVPVLQVGRTLLKGFEAGQWNSTLDAAGYPKSAPRRVAPPKKEAPTTPGSKTAPAPGAAEANPASGPSNGTGAAPP